MQGIIESLNPERGHFDWKWVGSVFVLHIVVMISAVSVLIAH